MEQKEIKNQQFNELKSSLTGLITEYQQARDLVNDQIQAVIYSDLVWLDSLVEQQLEKYELLGTLEEDFKDKLEGIFRDYCPEENQYSLTILLERLEKPSRELNKLRVELHDQVDKTQELREQLMDLLQFASKHNVDTFERIFQLGNNSESYGADGQMKNGSVSSVAINQKA
jgi:hypothetical protein